MEKGRHAEEVRRKRKMSERVRKRRGCGTHLDAFGEVAPIVLNETVDRQEVILREKETA